MKKSLSLAFLVLVLMHCGASAPNQTDVARSSKNSKNTGNSTASVSPQGFAADQILKIFGRKPGKDLGADKKAKIPTSVAAASLAEKNASEIFKLPPKPMTSAVPKGAKVPGFSEVKTLKLAQDATDAKNTKNSATSEKYKGSEVKKVKRLVLPPPPVPRMAVPQIRQEIQKILDLNKQIKNVQSGRAGQYRNVQEQAQLHQKILNDLENAKQDGRDRKIPQREDLLAQEKLRIIHEETQRNMALLEAANSARTVASNQGSSKSGVAPVSESQTKPRNP